MKFLIAALFIIGAVSAQTPAPATNPGRELVLTLEARADALLARARQILADNRGPNGAPTTGGANFLEALERQLVLVEALSIDLKAQTANVTGVFQIHHIHVIEEDLLRLENRVSEEEQIIVNIRNGQGNRGETLPQLIARAEQLVKDGQDAVTKFPQAQEVREINSEIIVVQALVKGLQATPAPTGAVLQQQEQELARQEATLRQLIDKATARRPTF